MKYWCYNVDERKHQVTWKKPHHIVWLKWWILCYMNFVTIKNKPPTEKIKKGKESCSGLMEVEETWQLNALYDCGLHPGLGGK